MRLFRLLPGIFLLFSCSSTMNIKDQPILFNDERLALTRDYLTERYGLHSEITDIIPKMIVLHWTAIPSLKKSFDTFNPPVIAGSRTDLQSAGALNVSAHFLVDQDGTVYRLMPETTMARHVIGLNHCAIGIENVGGTENMKLSRSQLRANIKLIKYLTSKYPIDFLIGHYEYTNFENHELWLEIDSSYRTQKTDPGKDFMIKIRKATQKLPFQPVPVKISSYEN